MKQVFTFATAVAICIGLMFSSCNKDENIEKTATTQNDTQRLSLKEVGSDNMIVLGAQMQDPYKLSNMQAALNQLMISPIFSMPISSITPTGRYVKVLAASEADLDKIEEDTTIVWFDYPLDYEIDVPGCYYHDPTLPDTATWKYGVVPMNYQAPSGVQIQEIYKVFIPEDMADSNFYRRNEDFFDQLEQLSGDLCGYNSYEKDYEERQPEQPRSGKWNPSATIRAWDDVKMDYVPLHGVKVVVKRCTKVREIFTDANGYCWTRSQFKNGQKVRYSIIWERAYWDIRDNNWQAYYNGPKQEGSWSLTISTGGKSLHYSAIHRALLFAFYSPLWTIQRPEADHKLKLRYIHDSCTYNNSATGSNRCNVNYFGIVHNITIYGYRKTAYLGTHRIIGTTFHELGHQSHYRYVGHDFFHNVTNKFIKDSWARMVEWYFTNQYYYNELDLAYNYSGGYQTWSNKDSLPETNPMVPDWYTPFFIDLYDNNNQFYTNNRLCYDDISGYTISEMQNLLLPYSYNLTTLCYTLHNNLIHNTTSSQIDQVVDYYSNLNF